MNRNEVAAWLNVLSDKQFIEFFYTALSTRHLYALERDYTESHLVLANARRFLGDDDQWEPWRLELLCPTPGVAWVDDAPVCQFGHHCGIETASWAKQSICPICGDEVHGT